MRSTTAILTLGMFMILASGAAIAQTPTWTYAQTLGLSTYSSNGRAIAADPFGNVVITGSFGNGNFEGAQNSTNSQDGLVSKRRADGSVAWSRRFGGGSVDQGLSVACDAQGNVIVGGHGYSAMIDFGWTLPAQGTFGATDAIIAKYDSTGAILWFDVVGGDDHDYTWGVATDAAGNVFAAGHFLSNSITFGNTTLTNAFPLSATGDVFLAKYSPSGQVIWAKRAGGVGGDRVKGLAVTPAGEAYVVGYFESTAFTFGTTSLTHAGGGTTAFILKFDMNGDPLWARQSTLGPGVINSLDEFAGVGLDAVGNVYVAGNFSAPSVSISGTTLINSGSGFDVMLVKYNDSGALQWASSGGGDGMDEVFGLHTNSSGETIISGQWRCPTASFGGHIITRSPNSGNFTYDAFVVGYDTDGNALWAISPDGSKDDLFSGVCQDVSGHVWVTGYYLSPTCVLGSFALYTSSNNSNLRTLLGRLTGLTTGVPYLAMEQDHTLAWPNPGDGLFWLDIPGIACDRPVMEVFDTKGHAIKATLTFQLGLPQIDLRSHPDGLYVVRIQCAGERFSTRVVKAGGW